MNGHPAKPAESKWTDEQWQAIVTRGDNVLVAAAAGSGKTAVLIERIIRIITSEQDPIDVDRLLVATFTKAAADEMRQRMRIALEKKMADGPESVHLRRQLALIHRASITTLHSFCMEVIGRYYHKIPLDPGFRIANEIEAELLRQDVIENVFEIHYRDSEPDSPFWELLDRYGGQRSDDALYGLVLRLYDFSRSHPFPDQWLRDSAAMFASYRADSANPIMIQLLQDAALTLESVFGLLAEAHAGAGLPGGPAVYVDTLGEELSMVQQLQITASSGRWEHLYESIHTADFGKLKPAKGDDLDKSLQERVKSLRDKAKKQLQELREQLFSRSPEQLAEEMRQCAPYMKKLTELVQQFGERFTEAKRAKRLVDFNDLEHYCLAVLCDGIDQEGYLLPTSAALEYQEHFVEVLIDEYQDTNQVQEAILSLLSRPGRGNRFMVGDVKQSIYRFRLADPSIFLGKYKRYQEGLGGYAIDLARNFRSRRQVVDGVNYVFKQIMEEKAAEINYDEQAELVYGAGYPDSPGEQTGSTVEVYLVHRQLEQAAQSEHVLQADENDEGTSAEEDGKYELETAELEARLVALQIREMVGMDSKSPYQVVVDRDKGIFRDATYRDIVILLRATQASSPVFIEQLRAAGIPAYAELSTGYFEAIEVDVMLSLLKVIDNPLQDIPLAGVLRSPIVGLHAQQLANIRLRVHSGSYYEALVSYVASSAEMDSGNDNELSNGNAPDRDRVTIAKLASFLEQLQVWRSEARNGSLSDLLWRIYRETGYLDYVGGLSGGAQRQANLKALYDRSRQFETTSLRGLFRFLRFIKRLQDSGGDLGAAKALGEQEDVVRIMSIHKSKGLEFPIVFIAGMAKTFNQRDLNGDFLLHKELGIGPLIVDPVLRVSYPSAAHLAVKRRMRMELLAEEMRILYVALTRAKEKLILIGTTRNIEQQLSKWAGALSIAELALPAHIVTGARSYFDWIGPAILRHPALQELRQAWRLGDSRLPLSDQEASQFRLHIVSQDRMTAWQEAAAGRQALDRHLLEQLAKGEIVDFEQKKGLIVPAGVLSEREKHRSAVVGKLEWSYMYGQAQHYYSKTSVTEIKRMRELALLQLEDSPQAAMLDRAPPITFRRPKFMAEKHMTAAERGTVYHAIMQQLPLASPIHASTVEETMQRMVETEMLRQEQLQDIQIDRVVQFFDTEMGKRLLRSNHIRKELPFSYGLRVSDLHPDAKPEVQDEIVLIQGVIDCLFEEEDGFVLLDYKTDKVLGNPEQTAEKYMIQLDLYAQAISAIVGRKVKEKALYFFDGGHLIIL